MRRKSYSFRVDSAKNCAPAGKVDRTAVVRIDQRQVPELGSLIEVGNSGNRSLEGELAEAVECSDQRRAPHEGGQLREEINRYRRIEYACDEGPDTALVIFVGIEPARLQFLFANRLLHELFEAVDEFRRDPVKRQRADQ